MKFHLMRLVCDFDVLLLSASPLCDDKFLKFD